MSDERRPIPEVKFQFEMSCEESVMLLHILDQFIEHFDIPDEFALRLEPFVHRLTEATQRITQ